MKNLPTMQVRLNDLKDGYEIGIQNNDGSMKEILESIPLIEILSADNYHSYMDYKIRNQQKRLLVRTFVDNLNK